jgi:hypothetical protein
MTEIQHEDMILIMVLSIGVFFGFLVFAVLYLLENNKYIKFRKPIDDKDVEPETVAKKEHLDEPTDILRSEDKAEMQSAAKFEKVNVFDSLSELDRIIDFEQMEVKEKAEETRGGTEIKKEVVTYKLESTQKKDKIPLSTPKKAKPDTKERSKVSKEKEPGKASGREITRKIGKPLKNELLKNYLEKENAEVLKNTLNPGDINYAALKKRYELIIFRENENISLIKADLNRQLDLNMTDIALIRNKIIKLEIDHSINPTFKIINYLQIKLLSVREKQIENTIAALKFLADSSTSKDIADDDSKSK